jgi:diadenylate cyclase
VVAVKNNAITPITDNLSLLHCLREHLGAPIQNASIAKRDKLELGTAAAFCIICMALIWFSFARGMDTLTSIEVPLEYMNRDTRMQIVSTSVNSVRLYLSGSGTLISSLRSDQVRVKLDLSGAKNGENNFIITNDSIVIPPGVRLNRIEPSSVKLVLDIPATKTMPIQVDWVGTLPEGLILEAAQVTPTQIEVEGPSQVLNQMSALYTQQVSLDNLKSSGQLSVSIALEPASIKIPEPYKNKVKVSYTIAKREKYYQKQ